MTGIRTMKACSHKIKKRKEEFSIGGPESEGRNDEI